MRKTRDEIINELQQKLGRCEHTEHLIDWILDTWETCDFLTQLLSREYAYQILEAREAFPSDIPLHEIVVYEATHEDLNPCSLN